MTPGTLYIVATPIGNLEDITLRALQVLRGVDLIACEDTRYSARLLAHYGITAPRESYHDHNEKERTPRLLEMMRRGQNIGLISDSGTPLISDPGYPLVSACRKEGIPVVPIPGPSAVIAALAGSGLPMSRFYFVGFLPPRSKARKAELEQLRDLPATLIFYEAPHRLLATLADMRAILGPRPACLAREMTKMHEEWTRGTLTELLEIMNARAKIRGEITLVVGPGPAGTPELLSPNVSLDEAVKDEVRKTGLSHKEALRAVARRLGISRKDAYRRLIEEK
jgi:16S rRNA (cytidine1402-2'-O)-methyltransferase